MRLLTLASASFIGGATISLINLLKGLKEKGIKIEVVVPHDGFLCQELLKLEIPYHFCPLPFSVWPNFKNARDLILFIPRLCRFATLYVIGYIKLRKIVKKFAPNIIHTNVSVIDVGFKVAQTMRIPHVWHVREYGDKDFDLYHFPSDNHFRKVLRERSYAICITKDIYNYFQLGSKAQVIYNGIENSESKISVDDKEKKFIFAGHLSDGKGTRALIREFSKFANEDKKGYILELWGASSDTYTKMLKDEISKLGMDDKIFLKGETKEIYKVMQKAKAIIVPSKYEGFGRITAEAMVNNCLVIGRYTAGTKEQFDNGKKHHDVEIGIPFIDDDEIPQCLKAVAEMGDKEYRTIINAANDTVKSFYNVNNNVNKSYDFFAGIITDTIELQ